MFTTNCHKVSDSQGKHSHMQFLINKSRLGREWWTPIQKSGEHSSRVMQAKSNPSYQRCSLTRCYVNTVAEVTSAPLLHSLLLYWFISNFTEFWPWLLIKFGKYWKIGQFSTYILYGALAILKITEKSWKMETFIMKSEEQVGGTAITLDSSAWLVVTCINCHVLVYTAIFI